MTQTCDAVPLRARKRIPSPLMGKGQGGGSGHTLPFVRLKRPNRKAQRDPPPGLPHKGGGERDVPRISSYGGHFSP